MKSKPNIENFISGGKEEVAPANTEKPRQIQKIFKISEEIAMELEQRCVDERRKLGRRVTQNELAEEALKRFLLGN